MENSKHWPKLPKSCDDCPINNNCYAGFGTLKCCGYQWKIQVEHKINDFIKR